MKNELKENKYLILTLIVLIALVIFTPVLYKSLNKNHESKDTTNGNLNQSNIKNDNRNDKLNSNQSESKNNNNNSNSNSNNNSTTNNGTNDTNNSQTILPDSNVNTNGNQNINNDNNSQETKPTEEDVINYFSETEGLITTYSSEPMTDSLKTKLKNGFTTIVDFLFYDKPIKGYTFKELTLSAKLKVCKIALSIDNKIDSYFPTYKDTIKNGFTSLKAKVVSMYLTLTSKACEVVGSNVCTQARSDFKNMKEILKLDLEFIKKVAGNSKEAISEWYQSIR